jgi:hypothetical protein
MQDLPVGLVSFLEYLVNLLFDLSGGTRGLRDEFDQVTRILQKRLDLGNIRKVVPPALNRYGQITRSLDQNPRLLNAFNGWNETGHHYSFRPRQGEATDYAKRTSEFKRPTFLTISF